MAPWNGPNNTQRANNTFFFQNVLAFYDGTTHLYTRPTRRRVIYLHEDASVTQRRVFYCSMRTTLLIVCYRAVRIGAVSK